MELNNKLTIKNLLLNKRRTLVTIIGMVIAVALLVTLSSVLNSIMYTLNQLYPNYRDLIMGAFQGMIIFISLIIVLISVYSIKNSFDISVSERSKQFGILKSLGATKRQLKLNVVYESFILGIIAIPIGVILGLIISHLLIYFLNQYGSSFIKAFIDTGNDVIIFKPSILSITLSIIFALLVTYFSSEKGAKRASKVSPIESIRNSAEIEVNSKKLKVPRYIKRIFGIGGEIAYKNLTRNKKKYKTIRVSIILAVFVFIVLSFGINSLKNTALSKYEINDILDSEYYNAGVSIYEDLKEYPDVKDKVLNSLKYDIVNESTISFNTNVYLESCLSCTEDYIKTHSGLEGIDLDIKSYSDKEYKQILEKYNLDFDNLHDKVILINIMNDNESGKYKVFNYNVGDKIELNNIDVEIGYISNDKDDSFVSYEPVLIMNDEVFYTLSSDTYNYLNIDISYKTDDVQKLKEYMDNDFGYLPDGDYDFYNYDEEIGNFKKNILIMTLILYGFIGAMVLICVTNIFNTITASMDLRKIEFAMLKSIGMTKKEFRNLIRLETIFLGLRSMLVAIPVSLITIFAIYEFYLKKHRVIPYWPIIEIIICFIVVFLLIAFIMRISMKKINKQNIIETIRNENI